MALKIYHGSCDCGKVTFEAALDLEQGTFKCNCKLCWKARYWGVFAAPDTFRILSGEDSLTIYGNNRKHYFCKVCGTKISSQGTKRTVSAAALDDLDPKVLIKAPIRYVDGRNDKFDSVPDFIEHL